MARHRTSGYTPAERELLASKVQRGTQGLKVRAPDASDITDPEKQLTAFPKHRPAPPLEKYVAGAIRAAHLESERKREYFASSPGPVEVFEDELDARAQAAERYARWRWHGFDDGDIASL
jgi:hypothetical protein